MTALDDALNESSVVYGPHQLHALWRESDLEDDGDNNPDTPTNLTPQADGTFVVNHAINDALPDPVTMTGDGDASGTLTAGLIGKEGLTLGSSGLRTYDSAGGSWDTGAAATTLTGPVPPTVIRDDFIITAILIDDNTASLVQVMDDPKDAWEFLGVVSDAPLAMHVYAKRRWRMSMNPQLVLQSDKPVDYVSSSSAFWARNLTSIPMDYRVSNITLLAEASSTTTHSVSSTLSDVGYQLGFWGSTSASGVWTPGAGLTIEDDPSANGLTLMSAKTALRDSGVYSISSSQAATNAVVVMAAVSIQPYQRPRMDVREYFSPFNVDSPVYGWDRDTADVDFSARVATASGPVDTVLFNGQMQDIKVQGRSAELAAVSKTRIALNRSITLPMVSGSRESLIIDWLVTYLMARGGTFIGPAPNRYTRYWAPLYGSLHAHWDTFQSYNAGFLRDSINPFLLFGLRNPGGVAGKWGPAMYAQQTATRQEEILMLPRNMHQMTTDDFPHLYENGADGPVMADMMSLANSRGRLQFWVRGDAAQSAPTYVNASDDFLVKMSLSLGYGGGNPCIIEVGIASNSRNPYVRMGTTAAGTLSTSFVFSGLPTDGQWHFYGFWWDFAAGTANACFDGSVITANGWSTGGFNDITGLPATDAAGRAGGWSTGVSIKSHLPASDFILDFGETYVAGQWARFYPTPEAPGVNAVYRSSYLKMNAIAEPTAVNAWDTLSDLAKSAQAWYRVDENDAYNWTIVEYFGKSAQMASVAVQDTEKNASDFDLVIDSSKIRNVITLKYPETRVDTQPQFILQYLTSTEIPSGLSQVTFPLDVPAVEIHGQSIQGGATWEVQNLTSSQITTPSLPKTNHYITVNTAGDGTGTVLSASSVSATIIAWDAGSVTLQFKNVSGATAYLANNGDQVPFLQILGYGARISDAYTTMRDSGSVALRRERSLDVEMPWIQTRAIAEQIAMQLANFLGRPIALVSTTVMGDPRRKPGQMVTLLDKQGLKVSGTWRVLSIEHNIDGPQYTQDLLLMSVAPIGIWDDPDTTWDNSVWGE